MNDLTIYEPIAKNAEINPAAIAIGAPDRPFLTYAGLLAQIDYVVREISNRGIEQNQAIAVVLPNGPEMAVSFLAISSAAICVPLNPAYRERECEFYLSDINAAALVIQHGFDSPIRLLAKKKGIPIIELIFNAEEPAGTFSFLRERPLSIRKRSPGKKPEDIALILHTSGTTAKPKKVPLTHLNLSISANNIRKTLQLTPSDRCLNVMPLYHIHGLIAGTLSSAYAGASIICTPGFDATAFFKWIDAFKPTWYTAVPTIHQAVSEGARIPKNKLILVKNRFRFIRSSSASLPQTVMKDLENISRAPVIEAYGMTEASHQIASNPLPPAERKPGSVGLAAGPETAIMNASGQLLAAEELGEIVVRGGNVILGYQNNPAANHAAFTNGWLRTGDQGRLDRDGYLFLTGRIKELINRAGEKIAPREIEEVLMEHPSVTQAVSFAIPHATLGEDVGAAVVLKKGALIKEAEIRRFVIGRLADFKVPQRILIVNELPKGATGKILRIGLAETFARELTAGKFVEPTNPLEETLSQAWKKILRQKRVGITDNYFELGGDSLLAVVLVAEARKAGIEFSPHILLKYPTISQLSAHLSKQPQQRSPNNNMSPEYDSAKLRRQVSKYLGVSPGVIQDVYPLTSFQHQNISLAEDLRLPHPRSQLQMSWTAKGHLDLNLFLKAWQETIAANHILRTGFVSADREFYQFVKTKIDAPLFFHSFEKLPKKASRDKTSALMLLAGERKFQLSIPPLFKIDVISLQKDLYKILSLYEHSIADYWTICLLEHEVLARYGALKKGKHFVSKSRPLFRDYVLEVQRDNETIGMREFWKKQIARFPWKNSLRFFLGADGRARSPGLERQTMSIGLSNELWQEINAWARRHALTAGTLFHGAWSLVLSRYSQSETVVFFDRVSGRWRDIPGVDSITGSIGEVFPLIVDVDSQMELVPWLSAIQDTLIEHQQFAHVRFDKLAKWCNLKFRNLPVWNVFVMENLPESLWKRSAPGLVLDDVSIDQISPAPLLVLVISAPKPCIRMIYDISLFSGNEISQLLHVFARTLEDMIGTQGNLGALSKTALGSLAPRNKVGGDS